MPFKKLLMNGNVKYILRTIEVLLITGLASMFVWVITEVKDVPTHYASAAEIVRLEQKIDDAVCKSELEKVIATQNDKFKDLDQKLKDTNKLLEQKLESTNAKISNLKDFLMHYFSDKTVTQDPPKINGE